MGHGGVREQGPLIYIYIPLFIVLVTGQAMIVFVLSVERVCVWRERESERESKRKRP